MAFRRTKSFGPKIRLTERQEERLTARLNAAGLTCFVEECSTGSVYIAIGLPEWFQNISGAWCNDLDCGCNDDVAKIRLSGHDEGRRTDSTHCCVGTKSECMAALETWVARIIEEHGPAGKAILANVPDGVLASG